MPFYIQSVAISTGLSGVAAVNTEVNIASPLQAVVYLVHLLTD